MGNKYYAVKVGRNPGIYSTWAECQEQVIGYKGAIYKKFSTNEEALAFINPQAQGTVLFACDDGQAKRTVPFAYNPEDLKDNEIIAYVDGSFDLDSKTYSYGVVIISNEGKETYKGREDNKELAVMRNVAGEIKGAMVAMDIAIKKGKDTLYIHYDYTGIENWAKGNWKTNKEGTKAYKEYYDKIRDQLKVNFIKVKAHSGVQYNEEADQLAKEAMLEDKE